MKENFISVKYYTNYKQTFEEFNVNITRQM